MNPNLLLLVFIFKSPALSAAAPAPSALMPWDDLDFGGGGLIRDGRGGVLGGQLGMGAANVPSGAESSALVLGKRADEEMTDAFGGVEQVK